MFDGNMIDLFYALTVSGIENMADGTWDYATWTSKIKPYINGSLIRFKWLEKWPNYCEKCDGSGIHLRGRGDETWIDDCKCIRSNTCPRCSQKGNIKVGEQCNTCGWNYNDELPDLPNWPY